MGGVRVQGMAAAFLSALLSDEESWVWDASHRETPSERLAAPGTCSRLFRLKESLALPAPNSPSTSQEYKRRVQQLAEAKAAEAAQ